LIINHDFRGIVMLTITEATISRRPVGPLANGISQTFRREPELPLGQDASDETLITAIARGDRHAMALLYGRHHVRVYRFALRVTGNATSAEDIVSDVFLDVWRQADGFKAKSQVSTWLLAIARNKSISAVKRRCDQQLDERTAIDIQDPADDPEMSVEKTDRSAVIRTCLSRLSAVHREVVDLVYYHERSVEEVARIVGAPVSTVKTRMFYARRRMGELLKDAGYVYA
jgi:RNA polymerase sigma-70 factor (ECF subfamily)